MLWSVILHSVLQQNNAVDDDVDDSVEVDDVDNDIDHTKST